MSYRLTTSQKWKLAGTLLLLYYPVLLYIDLPLYIENGIPAPGLLLQETITAIIVILIFFVWITVSEWLLNILFKQFGEGFLTAFNIWSQAITFGAAFVMGFGFVLISGEILYKTNSLAGWLFGSSFLINFPSPKSADFVELYKRANIGFFLVLMLSAFYLIGIRRSEERLRAATLRTAKLEHENTTAQLLVLRNQVNPHFLFNSLSILDSMVHEDQERSSAFINELAKFYRYSLEQAKDEKVDLRTELAFINSYSYLLQMRFDNKMETRISVDDPVLLGKKIPPLTIQLLIENAVKHNKMSAEWPLIIEIFTDEEYLVVKNNNNPRPSEILSTGTGLPNIRDRYKLLTEQPVTVQQNDKHFIVRVPLLT